MVPDPETEAVPPEEPSSSDDKTEEVIELEHGSESSLTGFAPSFHAVQKNQTPLQNSKGRKAGISFPTEGEVIDDFKIIEVLGEGAFGIVYLAEQLSLGRKIALKITSDRGEEARTMASLEHENIVRVFSETRDPDQGFRLICMQYISGPTLAEVIQYLNRHDPNERNGKLFIQAVDELSKGSTTLDPVALRGREFLQHADLPTVVAWIGSSFAEALRWLILMGFSIVISSPPIYY